MSPYGDVRIINPLVPEIGTRIITYHYRSNEKSIDSIGQKIQHTRRMISLSKEINPRDGAHHQDPICNCIGVDLIDYRGVLISESFLISDKQCC